MAFTHTPEFRKILWGGLAAWMIQAFVVLAWVFVQGGHASRAVPRTAAAAFVQNPVIAVVEPAPAH